jgi:hypothetical protein
MSLLQAFKSERAGKREKRSLERTAFAIIQGIVTAYGLQEDFLARLAEPPEEVLPDCARRPELEKEPFAAPLFPLATAAEYRLTLAILEKINNPYLKYVHSPEEILLSLPLFRRNPALTPDKLTRCHFRTLLWQEIAKERVKEQCATDHMNRGGAASRKN